MSNSGPGRSYAYYSDASSNYDGVLWPSDDEMFQVSPFSARGPVGRFTAKPVRFGVLCVCWLLDPTRVGCKGELLLFYFRSHIFYDPKIRLSLKIGFSLSKNHLLAAFTSTGVILVCPGRTAEKSAAGIDLMVFESNTGFVCVFCRSFDSLLLGGNVLQ